MGTRVLVIGGGITSAATSAFVTERLCSKNVQLTVWEKARGAGGRMSTSRSPGNSKCIADLGAQYISVTPEYEITHKSIYDQLIQENVIKPRTTHIDGQIPTQYNDVKDFVTTNLGMSSLVKYFFCKSGTEVNFNHHVTKINITKDKMFEVNTQDGKTELFDAAVMTMPVPQILQLPGMDQIIKPETKENLSNVVYSSRYALALFFDKTESSVILNSSLPETGAHYIGDDSVFCYAAIDGKKKGIDSPTSVIFHTKVPWGIKHLETPLKEVEEILLNHYKKRYPDWPLPTSVKCLRWRYSQTYKPFNGCPKAIVLNENPLLIAGGDGFMHKSGL